jgi:Tfp pilus assembly protein PilZ
MMSAVANDPGQGILSLTIRDTNSLYTAYMPFIKNGGLFVPTTKHYRLGDEVFLVAGVIQTTLPATGSFSLASIRLSSRRKRRRHPQFFPRNPR